jgi:hypothetical protein
MAYLFPVKATGEEQLSCQWLPFKKTTIRRDIAGCSVGCRTIIICDPPRAAPAAAMLTAIRRHKSLCEMLY